MNDQGLSSSHSTWKICYEKAAAAALDLRVASMRAKQSGTSSDRRIANNERRKSDNAIADFNRYWRHYASEIEIREILARLQKDLPKIVLENGTERRVEFLSQPLSKDPDRGAFEPAWSDADDFQRYLANFRLEIEYVVHGGPPTAREEWAGRTVEARRVLRAFLEEPEMTGGAAALSRRSRASDALELLEEVDRLASMMSRAPYDDEDLESESKGSSPPEHEQRWLLECFADIAAHAYDAGRYLQAAIGKEIESHALRGMKTLAASKQSAQQQKGKIAPRSAKILEIMREKIANGASASAAAKFTFNAGLGTSVEANRKLWIRNKLK